MKNESKIIVLDSEINFDKIYEKEYVPKEYISDIKKSNFLIIPCEKYKNENCIFFPECTREFLEYLRDSDEKSIVVDIASSDESFKQLELHSSEIEVATIIIKDVILSIAINLISSFLYDLVKKYRKKPENVNAKVNIITEETKSKKSKTIFYEGPVSGIKDALEMAAKDIFKNN